MPVYIVQSQGYCNCPEFRTLAQAKECLRDIVREEMQACRRRFGEAFKHKNGEDAYSITLASDSRSALWSAHSIVKA